MRLICRTATYIISKLIPTPIKVGTNMCWTRPFAIPKGRQIIRIPIHTFAIQIHCRNRRNVLSSSELTTSASEAGRFCAADFASAPHTIKPTNHKRMLTPQTRGEITWKPNPSERSTETPRYAKTPICFQPNHFLSMLFIVVASGTPLLLAGGPSSSS